MLKKFFLYLKYFDWTLFFSVILLASLGLIEIYSITLGREAFDMTLFQRQVFFVTTGIIIVFVFATIDYGLFQTYANYIYLIGALLLVAVLFFGTTIRGTTGWFDLGVFNLQPVEIVKIILIIYLAKFLSSPTLSKNDWKCLIRSGVPALILFILVALQPDFGSAMVLLAIWLVMVLLAGFNKKYFLVILLLGILAFGGMWEFQFRDYQKERILTFLNPSTASLEQGYNTSQAIIAVGAGGMAGRGIGFGSQSQLKFLPEVQTDFIFAVIAEELGFVGVTLLILFFGLFFYRCLKNLKKVNNDFGVFLILGGMGLIFIQMFINIGMNMGIFPVVGIPLPFISYGGSSLLTIFVLVGIMESVIIKSKLTIGPASFSE